MLFKAPVFMIFYEILSICIYEFLFVFVYAYCLSNCLAKNSLKNKYNAPTLCDCFKINSIYSSFYILDMMSENKNWINFVDLYQKNW